MSYGTYFTWKTLDRGEKGGNIEGAPENTGDLENILFWDSDQKRRGSGKLSRLLRSNVSYFLRRSQTIKLIPSFDLLWPNFTQIVRK